MSIANRLQKVKESLPSQVTLVAVSKTHPVASVEEAYQAGQKDFGENKVQELLQKQKELPADIRWHLIGHLQTNKVKLVVSFVSLIHSVDSVKLLQEINKQALKVNRMVDCLLQIHIASEETKFGMSYEQCRELLDSGLLKDMKGVRIRGLMGMASNTNDENQIQYEFKGLRDFFEECKLKDFRFDILSMGMSSDYLMAVSEGSNMVRVGSTIFGERNYQI
jgi:PLP dependent protein